MRKYCTTVLNVISTKLYKYCNEVVAVALDTVLALFGDKIDKRGNKLKARVEPIFHDQFV